MRVGKSTKLRSRVDAALNRDRTSVPLMKYTERHGLCAINGQDLEVGHSDAGIKLRTDLLCALPPNR